MGRLSLTLLGAPQVRHAEQVVTFPTRKTLALLIYLAVEGGQHGREQICAFFWPEAEPKQGRAALRKTLARLRQALDCTPLPSSAAPTSRQESSRSSHLLIEGDLLGFDFSADCDLDLHALQAAWNLARTWAYPISTTELPRPPLAELGGPIDRYRGDFLEGFSLPDAPDFDDWASLQREVWHRRVDPVFDRLSQWQAETGDLASALDTASRWVAHHPLNEAAHRRLMQIALAQGDRSAARHAYETCRAVLARDLNAQPSPETEALAQRVQTQILPHRTEQITGAQTQTDTLAPVVEVPFIGRAGEHARLAAAFHIARRGRAHLVTLEGEPGIGKTRLAEEFLGWAAGQGADVLQGRALEIGGRLPYLPLVEALRERLERENAPDDLLADVWLTELSRLLPELRGRYPDLPLPVASQNDAAAGTRLFEAVARLGQALGTRATVVLFIDDVQWADVTTLDLLQYVARRWTASHVPLLLVCTLRSEELPVNQPLADWLANLGREFPLIRIPLGPFNAEETIRLVQNVTWGGEATARHGSSPPAPTDLKAYALRLFAETGGQPFFIIETLRSLIEPHGWHMLERPSAPPMPSSVRELIRARLVHLSESALTACTAAAVLGDGFDFEQLCSVAGLGTSQALPAVDELIQRRLIRESGGRCFFGHDQIREVAYAEAGELRRRVLHRRALETLEAAAPPADLVQHALGAGLRNRASELSVAAGDAAMQQFAVRDAIGFYEQARLLGTEQPARPNSQNAYRSMPPSLELPTWLHLYTQLGRAYELTSAWDQARAMYEAMLSLAHEAGRPDAACAALNRLATVAFEDKLNLERAIPLLQQARHLAETSGDKAGLAETESNLMLVASRAGDFDGALTHGRRAVTLAQELGQSKILADSLNQMAYAHLWQGKWEEAEANAREAHSLYSAMNNRAMEVDCLVLMSETQIMLGQARAGLATARAAHALSLATENIWGQAFSAGKIGLALLEIGQYSEALSVAQAGVAAARSADITMLVTYNLVVLGAVYRALFALDAALAAHREALALDESLGTRFFSTIIAAELCADCVLAGEWGEAHALAQHALAVKDYGMAYPGLMTRWYATEALLRAGDLAATTEDLRRFADFASNKPRCRIPYLRALAVLARWEGNRDQAIAHLEAANVLAEAIGLPGEQWQILTALGELYRAAGDGDRTRRALTRTAEIVQALATDIEDPHLQTTFLGQGRTGSTDHRSAREDNRPGAIA